MIEYRTGNLLHSEAEALVNAVNCVGVMGKGIALQFKQAYPENFSFYERACRENKVKPGKVLVFLTGLFTNPQYIVNFPTKRHFRGKSTLEDIRNGLDDLIKEIQILNIKSIAVPRLGCGNGGLEWEEVQPLMEEAFARVPKVQVFIYEPGKGHHLLGIG
ncbi:macro domain-containing protein [Paenactinomyces guangxiensis]|uniref:Macro domain-containing protein n=1 Tax=Paenactinomyces guangxiensis TaxID=1490290 RepID=A0A7W1WQT5_9BACL|nr:macro domain-containing protein [Paenactinomyces guangxiensis]MBA4494365.1 macro domain-containing protein [Paenactinomyces guangxiensis]MBH8591580.1 macro domain-containing protein [Paenactinomyces guangxiensis]